MKAQNHKGISLFIAMLIITSTNCQEERLSGEPVDKALARKGVPPGVFDCSCPPNGALPPVTPTACNGLYCPRILQFFTSRECLISIQRRRVIRPALLVPEATGLGGGYFLTDYLSRKALELE
jgi:hypothetical protein